MIAANIDQCITYTQPAVSHWAQSAADNLYDHLRNWETTFLQFDDALDTEGTVRDWKVPTAAVLATVPNSNSDQSAYISDVIKVVYGACAAAKFAQAAGRITAAQRDQMVTDWNTYWGF